jgi:hypothetical protein
LLQDQADTHDDPDLIFGDLKRSGEMEVDISTFISPKYLITKGGKIILQKDKSAEGVFTRSRSPTMLLPGGSAFHDRS